MQVRVKLMGALKSQAPADGTVEVSENATVQDVLDQLGVEARQLQVVMVNGRPRPDRATSVAADDELTLLPPVGGG